MSGSALEGRAVFEGESQAAIRAGCGVIRQVDHSRGCDCWSGSRYERRAGENDSLKYQAILTVYCKI